MPRNQRGLARLVEREGVSPRVVEAFSTIDRAAFVPHDAVGGAYRDRPIGIPDRQTTSQPTLIARMIDALEIEPQDVVLEVGTGFGFQTALLAALATRVVSIERFADLADAARENLREAGVDNATVIVGDGWNGAPEHGPFDAIVVSAAATEVPSPLVEQMTEGARMVIPLRADHGDAVYLFRKRSGELRRERLLTPAYFVPLVPGEPA